MSSVVPALCVSVPVPVPASPTLSSPSSSRPASLGWAPISRGTPAAAFQPCSVPLGLSHLDSLRTRRSKPHPTPPPHTDIPAAPLHGGSNQHIVPCSCHRWVRAGRRLPLFRSCRAPCLPAYPLLPICGNFKCNTFLSSLTLTGAPTTVAALLPTSSQPPEGTCAEPGDEPHAGRRRASAGQGWAESGKRKRRPGFGS